MPEEDKNKTVPPPGKPADGKKANPGDVRKPGGPVPSGRQPAPLGRSPRSAIVWLIVLLGIGVLVLFKGYKPEEVKTFTQTEFETMLADRRIRTAELVPKTEAIYEVTGTFLLPQADATVNSAQPSSALPDANAFAAPKTDADVDPAPAKAKPEKIKVRTEGEYRSMIILSEQLDNQLRMKTQVTVSTDSAGYWQTLLLTVVLPIVLILGIIYFFSARQMRMGGRGAMDFGKSRARMIQPEDINVKFDDIAGADEVKEEISEIVEYLKDPLRFQLVGGQIPKGCLLVGEPGTGKTLMAKAVACEAGVPFFSISGSDFVEMFVGVGASRVRDMFDQARKHMPSLIFIDEIDAVGRSRFSGWGGGHDEREQTLNAMLVEMDGLESHNGVIVLAATNRPDVLDPALLRPGRFDRQVVMDLPDIKGRRQILDVHIKKIKVVSSIDLDVVARTTPGFSGADLANLCNEAALLAARRNREAVTQADLEEARDKVSYGAERRSRKITDRERKLTAYHEAGHTLVALHNEHCVPVHKVTIIPRGQAYLGATFTMPKEDVYCRSKLELEADMSMTMGGRAAEELIFGDITTGASADINHLTDVARRMVCLYGMSEKLGPVKCGEIQAHPRVRIDLPPEDPCSQETAREIDLEVRRLITNALNSARECLTVHRDELEKLALALLERETLSIDDINKLLGREVPETVVTDDQPAVTVRPETGDGSSAAEGIQG